MKKLVWIFGVVVAIFLLRNIGLDEYLSFAYLKENIDHLKGSAIAQPLIWLAGYFAAYVLTTTLSLPGATVLTLAGGAVFGFWKGLLIVSFASTIGATLAFLLSRYLFKEWVQKKFGKRLESIQRGIQKDGALYLLSLRLVPIFPFFLVNLLMGLTPIGVWKYYWVSQVGMLAGTAVYVNAGTQLAQLESLSGILSPSLLAAFALLGIFPLLSKWVLNSVKAAKVYAPYAKPKSFDYNLLVIGAGSAGLVTSYIAATVKSKVLLVEKNKMGGDCLNTGCVPSKALIKSAKVAQLTKDLKKYGLRGSSAEVNFAEVMDRVQQVIKKIEPHDSIERYESLGVECAQASAEILTPFSVKVGERIVTTRNIVVATGARPLVPDFPGLNEVPHFTSDNIWSLREMPERLLVLGGGPIGCELTQAFSRLGSKVTQVEMGPRLMGREETSVSEHIEKRFAQEGIDVLTGHKALSFKKSEHGKSILLCEDSQGKEKEIVFDVVLMAIGRKANVKGFGLERLGIDAAPSGTVDHDAFLRTKFPNILVCGDVAGPFQFTHTASHQAWYAAVNALFSPFASFKADYRVIPWCTFTDPEVARVGMSFSEAQKEGIYAELTRYGIDDLDRAIADSEDEGFVEVVTEKGSDKILGATIVGTQAGNMIAEFVIAMKHNLGLNKILGTIHIYPTHSEANKFVAGQWKQKHKPELVLFWVEKFHAWRRKG